MLLPLLAWAITGAVFFLKPGYGAAYDSLAIRTYPLTAPLTLTPAADWREVRHLRTALGLHVLVRTDTGWHQVDPETLQPRPVPDDAGLRTLLIDAFTANPERYGQIAALDGRTVTTSTGVQVKLDWNRMTLAQRGPDTDRIDFIYSVHYLQWTGITWLDRIVGGVGLVLLVALSLAGVRLLTRRGRD